jgi:hypothetical protein
MRLILAAAATLFLSTNAALAQAAQVNITDPNKANRAVQVEPGSRLAVQEVPPASYFHSSHLGISLNGGCVQIAVPPSGKALIIKQVRVNADENPNPGNGSKVYVYANGNCAPGIVGSVTPQGLGLSTITFEPGLAVPSGGFLSAVAAGSLQADVYADGYVVASGVAPPVGGQTIQLGRQH